MSTIDTSVNGTLQSRVMRYFEMNPGRSYAEQMAQNLDFTRAQILKTVLAIIQRKLLPGLHKEANGVWYYTPEANPGHPESNGQVAPEPEVAAELPSTPMFEQITVAIDGRLVLRSDAGGIYLAEKIA